MNLAWSELYRLIAEVMVRFDMELFDTTEKDIKVHCYTAASMCSLESNGIRVRITGMREL